MKIAGLPSTRRKNLTLIVILAVALPILIYATYQVVNLISKAGVEAQPKNVVISNLTTSSVTIGWSTEEKSRGSVIPVLNGDENSPKIDKRGSSKRYTHYVELTDLEPNTTYNFLIVSDSKKYSDEGEKEFKFKTAPITTDTPTPNPVHGAVSGNSEDDVIIYAFFKDKSTYPVSTIIPSGGNWIMDLSTLRDVDDKSLVLTNDNSNLVVVAVGGITKGDVVEGIYNEIFDSNGKLKETNGLEITDNETLYSYFPSESKINTYAIVDNDTDDDDNDKDNDNVYTPPVIDNTDDEEEPDTDDEEFNRDFALKKDLKWIDMISVTDKQVTGITGEDSILVTNLTDTGFTVLWVSDIKEQGSVNYGTSTTSLEDEAVDERDGLTNKGSYYVHSVNISRLEPDTQYYFKVISGDDEYTNSDEYFTVTTFSTLSSPPTFQSVVGVVDGVDDSNEVAVVGYIKNNDEVGSEGNSVMMSTLTDENGKWIMSIADSRIQDGSTYYEYSDSDILAFDLLTTVDTNVQNESMEGITDRDIELTLSSSNTGVSYTKVTKLDAYGVLGVGSVNLDTATDSSDSDSSVNVSTSNTPQTGLRENILFMIFLGIIPVVIFVFVVVKNNDVKGKNNMRSVIN